MAATVINKIAGTAGAGLGENAVTVGDGGDYATIADALTYLKTLDVVESFTLPGTPTCSCTQGSKTVTLSADADLVQNDELKPGEAWSPDGDHWYTVDMIRSETVFDLKVPLQEATVSGGTTYTGRPIYRNMILLPGEYTEGIDLDTVTCMFLTVEGMPGAIYKPPTTGQIQYPRSGWFELRNLFCRGDRNIFINQTLGYDKSTEVFLFNINMDTTGVDIMHPNCRCGKLKILNCELGAANDGLGAIQAEGYAEVINSKIRMICHPAWLASPFFFGVRMCFNNGDWHFINCDLYVDSNEQNEECIFQDPDATGTTIFEQCRFNWEVGDNKAALAGKWSAGTTFNKNIIIRGGAVVQNDVNTGTISLFDQTTSWTQVGSIDISWFDKQGMANGGTGLTITETNNKA